MAEESFFNLIGVKKEEATPKLARDVLEIVTDFVSKMRRRWNDPKIGRDIDKLKKKDKTFLDQYFQLPDLATKKQGMKKQNAAKSGEAQPKAEAPTVAPKPPQKRPLDDDSVPFLDKVKCINRAYFYATKVAGTSKSWILMTLGWVDILIGGVHHAKYF